ncbi:MAG: hypothetical protein LPL29_14575 [Alphaproteobacteria bacterium]|nr:hypothetical protein [Alphaproteobacteria bacterium]
MTALVMWSGGLDSTASLVYWLRYTRDPVLALHIRLINHEDRWAAEGHAVARQKAWICANIRDFTLKTITIDLNGSDLHPPDMASVVYAAGLVVRDRPDVSSILIGTCVEEGHNDERWNAFARMIEGAAWPRPRMPALCMPCAHMTKAKELEFVGPELAQMFWSCRTPVRTEKGWEECGRCETCVRIDEARKSASFDR